MVATMVNGVILVIIPLLALTADQISNTTTAIQDHGSEEAHHLDDTTPAIIRGEIIPRMEQIPYNTSSTMVIFSLPQFIVKNSSILKAIPRCHARQTLRLVAIDEDHL